MHLVCAAQLHRTRPSDVEHANIRTKLPSPFVYASTRSRTSRAKQNCKTPGFVSVHNRMITVTTNGKYAPHSATSPATTGQASKLLETPDVSKQQRDNYGPRSLPSRRQLIPSTKAGTPNAATYLLRSSELHTGQIEVEEAACDSPRRKEPAEVRPVDTTAREYTQRPSPNPYRA